MDELLLTLTVSLAALAVTGIAAVFKGQQLLDWLHRKDEAIKVRQGKRRTQAHEAHEAQLPHPKA